MSRKKIRQWLRKRLKAASSEGVRHWIMRLQRTEDSHYQELRNEIDIVRRALREHKDSLELIIKRMNDDVV